ncbi:MAG: hypothetical protein U1E65_22395 [Myxococcota bacterium]
MIFGRAFLLGLLLGALLAGCRGTVCKARDDCPDGFYCVIDPDHIANGSCQQDCVTGDDCPVPDTTFLIGVCTLHGRCSVAERTPHLRVLSPENDSLLPEGTRQIQLAGDVETLADRVDVSIQPTTASECGRIAPIALTLMNTDPGKKVSLSFVTTDLELDPGVTTFQVSARVGHSTDSLTHKVEVPCPGCAQVFIDRPSFPASVNGLELSGVHGHISPPNAVSQVIWRLQSALGDVIDGSAPVVGGNYDLPTVPVFPGVSRLRVVVSGVGSGLGETRCSVSTVSSVLAEKGLRALLTWDGTDTDLDLHLIGPGGSYKLTDDLYSGQADALHGTLDDAITGYGPETLSVKTLPDGVYGLVVEPVSDGTDPGSNAIVRLLWDGRLMTKSPIGPEFLSVTTDDLWVVGTLTISQGQATFSRIGSSLSANRPPTRAPADWPNYY